MIALKKIKTTTRLDENLVVVSILHKCKLVLICIKLIVAPIRIIA